MKRISYFVQNDENGFYFRTLSEAVSYFMTYNPNTYTYPSSLEKHSLTYDAFERAYNGGGGFVETSIVIRKREDLTSQAWT